MTQADLLKLDNQLCFALYAGSRAVTRLYRPLLEKIGLTYPQYLVMLVLWEQPNDPINVKTLGERLMLDSGTLTPLLKRLESIDLIERRRNAIDERVRLISLTEKGISLKEQARCIPASLIKQVALEPEQLRLLKRQLQGLLNSIGSAG